MMTESNETTQAEPVGSTTEGAAEEQPVELPLRAPSEDPTWAVRTVWTWVGMAIFLLIFILLLIILGYWFD
jgi:hypothetical protein